MRLPFCNICGLQQDYDNVISYIVPGKHDMFDCCPDCYSKIAYLYNVYTYNDANNEASDGMPVDLVSAIWDIMGHLIADAHEMRKPHFDND